MQTDCMPTDLYGRTTMNHSVWCAWADMNWDGDMTSPVIVSALRAETVTQLLRREKEADGPIPGPRPAGSFIYIVLFW